MGLKWENAKKFAAKLIMLITKIKYSLEFTVGSCAAENDVNVEESYLL